MIAYIVTNTVNGKKYIGITKAATTGKRWRKHLELTKSGSGYLLHKAIAKYGVSSFAIEHTASAKTWSDLCAVEIALITQYGTHCGSGSGYNMTRGGDGTIGHSPSTEARAKLRAANLGKKLSPETLAKVVAASTGRRHPPRSPETRKRLSLAATGKRHTEETRARMAATRMITDGMREKLNASLKGIPKSIEHVEKMRLAATGKRASNETRNKMSAAHKGHSVSVDSREKMRKAALIREQKKRESA